MMPNQKVFPIPTDLTVVELGTYPHIVKYLIPLPYNVLATCQVYISMHIFKPHLNI